MRRYLLLAGALAFLMAAPEIAAADGPGTYMATFLEVDGGTRQMGMGGAFTGLADDALAIYYNPAGLRSLDGSEIHFSTSSWPAKLSYQHLAYGFRHSVVPGYFGISWTIMQMPPFAEKTEYYDPDSEFGIGIYDNVDAGDMAWGGTYCWAFNQDLSVGATLKWYHLAMADAFCDGMCGDLGALYDMRLANRTFRLGAAVMNLGPKDRWSWPGADGAEFGEDFSMPTVYRAGASMRIYDVVTHRVVLAADCRYPRTGDLQANVGGEYTFHTWNVFAYGRAGYRFGYDEESLTLGLGVRFPSSQEADARIDYAYADMGNLGYVQRLAVSFYF